jgi:hypothetical protein
LSAQHGLCALLVRITFVLFLAFVTAGRSRVRTLLSSRLCASRTTIDGEGRCRPSVALLELPTLPGSAVVSRLYCARALWEWHLGYLADDAAELAYALVVMYSALPGSVILRITADNDRLIMEIWREDRGRGSSRFSPGEGGVEISGILDGLSNCWQLCIGDQGQIAAVCEFRTIEKNDR